MRTRRRARACSPCRGSTARAAARSWWRRASPTSATCAIPHGTMIIDVSDPKHPKQLGSSRDADRDALAQGARGQRHHGHQPRDTGRRARRAAKSRRTGFRGGLGIYDVSNPAKPRHITNWEATDKPGRRYARGVHRFDFDGRYAYISPTCDGYLGNIVMILDLKDPAKPEEVGRWWLPGQWTAGGEKPTWKGTAHRCHHPLRYGNRLYTSYWHGGFVILDIDDMTKPKCLAHVDWSPPFPWPTHTCLRIPFKIEQPRFHGRLRRGRGTARRLPAASRRLPVDGRHHRREASDRRFDLPDRGHARRGSSPT